MSFRNNKNVNNASIDANGNVIFGDGNTIINLKEAAQYIVLEAQLEKLDKRFESVKVKITKYPEDEDFRNELLQIDTERTAIQQDIEVLKKEVLKLADIFTKITINTEPLRLAKLHFESGEFSEAKAVLNAEQMGMELDILLAEKERIQQKAVNNNLQLQSKSDEYLILARLTALDFQDADRFEKAQEYFQKSISAAFNGDNVSAFSLFLWEHKMFDKAKSLQLKLLQIIREVAKVNPEKYLSDLAMTLINLALILADNDELKEAEDTYIEALEISRDLAKTNPQEFLPFVAMTLSNYVRILRENNDLLKAKDVCNEALEIRRDLASTNPQTYLPNVALTLNNLGNLLKDNNELQAAEDAFIESLEINRELVSSDSKTFLPALALTLSNYGSVLITNHQFKYAEDILIEALEIRKKLAKDNPQAFLPDVADTLNSLGTLFKNKNEKPKALNVYNEALKIRRELAWVNSAFLPDVAKSLTSLGDLLDLQEAEGAYKEALEIRRKLTVTNPKKYMADVATTLNNLGLVLKKKEEWQQAKEAYNEALDIKRKLAITSLQAFLPNIATTLFNLGQLLAIQNELPEAEKVYMESLEIRKELALANPQAFLPEAAKSAAILALFYLDSSPDPIKSLAFAQEAEEYALPSVEYLRSSQEIIEEVEMIIDTWYRRVRRDQGGVATFDWREKDRQI